MAIPLQEGNSDITATVEWINSDNAINAESYAFDLNRITIAERGNQIANEFLVGESTYLVAWGEFSDNVRKVLTDQVRWTHNKVFSINRQTGMLTALGAASEEKIVAELVGETGEITVTAVGLPEITEITVDSEQEFNTTLENIPLQFTATENGGTDVTQLVNWSLSGEDAVGSIQNNSQQAGEYVSQEAGYATVVATLDGVASGDGPVEVYPASDAALSVSVEEGSTGELLVGGSQNLVAKAAVDTKGEVEVTDFVTWSVSERDSELVSVNDGVAVGLAPGRPRVGVELDGETTSNTNKVSLTVTSLEKVSSLVIQAVNGDDLTAVPEGISVQLSALATVEDLDGSVQLEGHNVTELTDWSVDHPGVSISSTGLLTVQPGAINLGESDDTEVTVTAQVSRGRNKVEATLPLTLVDLPIVNVTLEAEFGDNNVIAQGVTIPVTVIGELEDGTLIPVAGDEVSWGDDPNIVLHDSGQYRFTAPDTVGPGELTVTVTPDEGNPSSDTVGYEVVEPLAKKIDAELVHIYGGRGLYSTSYLIRFSLADGVDEASFTIDGIQARIDNGGIVHYLELDKGEGDLVNLVMPSSDNQRVLDGETFTLSSDDTENESLLLLLSQQRSDVQETDPSLNLILTYGDDTTETFAEDSIVDFIRENSKLMDFYHFRYTMLFKDANGDKQVQTGAAGTKNEMGMLFTQYFSFKEPMRFWANSGVGLSLSGGVAKNVQWEHIAYGGDRKLNFSSEALNLAGLDDSFDLKILEGGNSAESEPRPYTVGELIQPDDLIMMTFRTPFTLHNDVVGIKIGDACTVSLVVSQEGNSDASTTSMTILPVGEFLYGDAEFEEIRAYVGKLGDYQAPSDESHYNVEKYKDSDTLSSGPDFFQEIMEPCLGAGGCQKGGELIFTP